MRQRILTGLILLPLLVLFVYFAGPAWFAALVTVVAIPALHELFSMSLPADRVLEKRIAVVAGALLVPLVSLAPSPWGLGGIALAFIFIAILFLLRFRDLASVITQINLILLGFIYVPLLLAHLAMLRGLPDGRGWVFLVMLVVMAGDSAAYFSGINFGRHKLYPAISPKKSIEGAIGGLLGSLAGAFLAKLWFLPMLTGIDTLFLGLVLGSVGQLGDLFESMLKRSFGVKDSGTLIPGHGGILDRLDSLLFVFPLAYYYALLRFGA
nr:phosphatidate cytidylyltransferase [Desulfuromonas sp. DDH964]